MDVGKGLAKIQIEEEEENMFQWTMNGTQKTWYNKKTIFLIL